MSTSWERFKQAARLGEPDRVPVGLIVDSPWLPGYAGIDTRDYFLFPDKWLEINLGLLERFPEAVWIPGFWVEYGMAAEPSAFGVKLRFHPDRPPSIEPLVSDLSFWADVKPANTNGHCCNRTDVCLGGALTAGMPTRVIVFSLCSWRPSSCQLAA